MQVSLWNATRRRLGDHALTLLLVLNILGAATCLVAYGPWIALALALASVGVWVMPAPAGRRRAQGFAPAAGALHGHGRFERAARVAKVSVFVLMILAGIGLTWVGLKINAPDDWLDFAIAITGLVMSAGGVALAANALGINVAYADDDDYKEYLRQIDDDIVDDDIVCDPAYKFLPVNIHHSFDDD